MSLGHFCYLNPSKKRKSLYDNETLPQVINLSYVPFQGPKDHNSWWTNKTVIMSHVLDMAGVMIRPKQLDQLSHSLHLTKTRPIIPRLMMTHQRNSFPFVSRWLDQKVSLSKCRITRALTTSSTVEYSKPLLALKSSTSRVAPHKGLRRFSNTSQSSMIRANLTLVSVAPDATENQATFRVSIRSCKQLQKYENDRFLSFNAKGKGCIRKKTWFEWRSENQKWIR